MTAAAFPDALSAGAAAELMRVHSWPYSEGDVRPAVHVRYQGLGSTWLVDDLVWVLAQPGVTAEWADDDPGHDLAVRRPGRPVLLVEVHRPERVGGCEVCRL